MRTVAKRCHNGRPLLRFRTAIALCALPVAQRASAQSTTIPEQIVTVLASGAPTLSRADSIADVAATRIPQLVRAGEIVPIGPRQLARFGTLASPGSSGQALREWGLAASQRFRAPVLELNFAARRDDTLELHPELLLGDTRTVIPWQPIVAAKISDAAELVAQQIVADSTLERLRRPSTCANGMYFDFQVDRPAAYITDSLAAIHPVTARERGSLVQFIVDTTGVPNPLTIRLLRELDPSTLTSIYSAVGTWRFTPAELHGCKVRQLVQLPINR